MKDIESIYDHLKQKVSQCSAWSIRLVTSQSEYLSNRHGILKPPETNIDQGVMITVYKGGASSYAATSDLTSTGIDQAWNRACDWASEATKSSLMKYSEDHLIHQNGSYSSDVLKSWHDVSFSEKSEILGDAVKFLKSDPRIIDSSAGLWFNRVITDYMTDQGAQIKQDISWLNPTMRVIAHDKGVTERRTFGGHGVCRQGGLEILEHVAYLNSAQILAEEALELVYAPHCPNEICDVILDPDQMILQIHESIGHPLEIDRILGDERNYAGGSFVKKDMFGSYQYGSSLLNVCFDPTVPGELASYSFDDEGDRAQKTYLIKDGLLLAGLGGRLSQKRSNIPGVANSRAVGWNRPPIDRMANLNLEPGAESLDQMISSIDRGIYMKTNTSWSIDDHRNKFQFGCEWGRLIENGRLTSVVKKPNYRDISSRFWHKLAGVGNLATADILGTPFCGKGEPNQAIFVGHASPACLFRDIQVFGGE